MRILWIVGLVAGVALLLAGCGSGGESGDQAAAQSAPAAKDYVPTFEPAPCRFPAPVLRTVECGDLVVPEDRWDATNTRSIRLHVGIFRTGNPEAAADPIVYLAGGPGAGALASAAAAFGSRFGQLLVDRDLIIFDQRGTGFSVPSLACPETDVALLEALRAGETAPTNIIVRALASCHARLSEMGVTLGAYNSLHSAADVEDLRRALGYLRWNVFGTSYGTRLAQTLVREHPDGIRTVVLDSVLPMAANLLETATPNAQRAFDALFAGCRRDETCAATYPGLEETFYLLLDRLERTSQELVVLDPVSGEAFMRSLDGPMLVGLLFGALYNTDLIRLLPRLITDADAGDFRLVRRLLSTPGAGGAFSFGMHLSVQCHEEIPFNDRAAAAAATATHEAISAYVADNLTLGDPLFAVCAVWPVGTAAASENEPVRSAIPALVLAGEMDPITPPGWGQDVAAGLERAVFVELPGMGHGIATKSSCAGSIVVAFLADPERRPDTSCVAQVPHTFVE